ncbi:HNH endonuclease [Methanobrevibacter sp.]|uniref:HNH endonuclease n=1 Tax=Methanobrevibacter sp. TaxID=66852 RepID=UPI003869B229
MNTKIKTRFGTAMINADGYYEITSVKEGNKDKILHRLIYQDFHNILLPRNVHVHHKNNNKLDNCVLNLEAMAARDHARFHRCGSQLPISWMVNMSRARQKKSKGSTKYFRVTKENDSSCKLGYIYIYQYYEEGRRRKIKAVDIKRLEEKVKSKGLVWMQFTDDTK